MESVTWYAILTVGSVIAAVFMRLGVYLMLVKFNRWLPEKATKVANISMGVVIGLALLGIVGNALLSKH